MIDVRPGVIAPVRVLLIEIAIGDYVGRALHALAQQTVQSDGCFGYNCLKAGYRHLSSSSEFYFPDSLVIRGYRRKSIPRAVGLMNGDMIGSSNCFRRIATFRRKHAWPQLPAVMAFKFATRDFECSNFLVVFVQHIEQYDCTPTVRHRLDPAVNRNFNFPVAIRELELVANDLEVAGRRNINCSKCAVDLAYHADKNQQAYQLHPFAP